LLVISQAEGAPTLQLENVNCTAAPKSKPEARPAPHKEHLALWLLLLKVMDLCERFYIEAVQPILKRHFSNLTHSAGRLGQGSDVLGLDTPTSMDHDWGPKSTLFLQESDFHQYDQKIDTILGQELPPEICGFPTNFAKHEDHTTWLQKVERKPIIHDITVTTISIFFQDYIGLNPLEPIEELDWLSLPPQKLRTISSGRVFHDGLRKLEVARQNLRW